MKIHPTIHIFQLSPPAFCPLLLTPTSTPRLSDNHPAFMTHCLVDIQCRIQGVQYLVDWDGYGPEESCWLPHSFILDPDLSSTVRILIGLVGHQKVPIEGEVLLRFCCLCLHLGIQFMSVNFNTCEHIRI